MNLTNKSNSYVSILTQDLNKYHQENISYSMLFKQFYNHLERDVLRNDHIYTIIDTCSDAIVPGTSNTSFTKLKDIEQARDLKPNKRRNDAYTILNNVGLTLKRKGTIYICPLLRCKNKSKIYEAVIEYYYFLFPELFPQLTTRNFKDGLPNLEGLREWAINETYTLQSVRNYDEVPDQELETVAKQLGIETSYSYEQLYNIAFKNIYSSHKARRSLQDEKELAIKQSILSTYRNAGNELVDVLAYIHSRILEDLLPIMSQARSRKSRTFYFHKKLPDGFRANHYTTSETYVEYSASTESIMEDALEYIEADTSNQVIDTLKEQLDDFSDLVPAPLDPLEEKLKQNEVDSKVSEFYSTLDSFESPAKKLTPKEVEESDYQTWLSFEHYNKRHSFVVMDDQHHKFLQRYKLENNQL